MSWAALAEQVARVKPVFWLRDDDAVTVTPALTRFLDLARKHEIPVALAVIPDLADPGLFDRLGENVSVLQHGCDHRNRAAADEKKTEYPASERDEDALARLRASRERLASLAGARALPVLAPPWNRMRADLAAQLPRAGIGGFSGYGEGASVPNVRQVNTYVDIVAWRDGKRFIGDDEAARLALPHITKQRPVGWLTHHAAHDAAAWRFLERLFALRGPRWAGAAELFSYTRPAHG